MSADMWNRVARSALCQTLGDLGTGLGQTAAWTLGTAPFTGGATVKPGLVMLGGAGAANLVYSYGCSNDPADPAPPWTPSANITCGEVTGCGHIEISLDGTNWIWGAPYYDCRKIISTYKGPVSGSPSDLMYWFVEYERCDGTIANGQTGWSSDQLYARIVPLPGSQCVGGDSPIVANPGPYESIEITDVDTNCTSIVNIEGFVTEGADRIGAVVKVIQKEEEVRASGGRIGGCNWAPTYVYLPPGGGGGDDPPVNFPVPDEPEPPSDGTPVWLQLLKAALTGATSGIVAKVLNDFFAKEYPEDVYRLVSVCEKNEQGEPISQAVEEVIPKAKQFDAVISRLDALVPLLQGQKDFKQPICETVTEIPEGDWRTISFRSHETSPYGKSRLRKRFKYLSISGNDLETVVNHWRDFTWEGGPYRVRWIGRTWRTPEVWAATEAEGKRVIQHAAREAGFDPLEGGEWRTRISSSTRLGVYCSLSVDTTGGYYWITARDGSDQRPTVRALSPDDIVGDGNI